VRGVLSLEMKEIVMNAINNSMKRVFKREERMGLADFFDTTSACILESFS